MRRRNRIQFTAIANDPGKDLFAYLFLLIMVFSFMLLMSVDPSHSQQRSPDQGQIGTSRFSAVSRDHVAELEIRDNRLHLRFGRDLYDPVRDMDKLVSDNRITRKTDKGRVQKILYINKQEKKEISLFDYLDTFKIFSDHRISIAFVKVVR